MYITCIGLNKVYAAKHSTVSGLYIVSVMDVRSTICVNRDKMSNSINNKTLLCRFNLYLPLHLDLHVCTKCNEVQNKWHYH